MASASPGISMLNTATGSSPLMAACSAIFMAKVVLPMEGRPATMIRSPRLQAGGAFVEIVEACGDAGHRTFALKERVDAVDHLGQDVPNAHKPLLVPPTGLGDLEDQAFGLVQQFLAVAALGLEGRCDHIGTHPDQPAQHRPLTDDIGIGGNIGGRGCVLGEGADIAKAAGFLQKLRGLQPFAQSDDIQRKLALGEHGHAAIHEAMVVPVEIFFADAVGDLIPGLVVDHQAAQNGLFRLQGMGRYPQGSGFGGGTRFRHGSEFSSRVAVCRARLPAARKAGSASSH